MLSEWFDGQGEQDCEIWFEENGVPSPHVDNSHVGERLVGDDVIVYCK